jgi:hypothetical protein
LVEVEDPTLLFDPEPDPARRRRRSPRRRRMRSYDPDPARKRRRSSRRRRMRSYDPEPVLRRVRRRISFGGFKLMDVLNNLSGAYIVGFLAKKYPIQWIKLPITYPPTNREYEIPASALVAGVALPLFFKRGMLNDLGNKILAHNFVPLFYGYAGWKMSGSPVWGGSQYTEKVEEKKMNRLDSVQVPEVWR